MKPALEWLAESSHACLIYQNPDQQMAVVSQFLKIGLERDEQCVLLEMPEKLAMARLALKGLGVDTAAAEARKALILTAKRDFLDRGRFDGPRAIDFLMQASADAIEQGFNALRITGDMNWELGADQDFRLLIDYEANLDDFLTGQKIVGMCQYQRYSVSSLAICNALETHESVILGDRFCAENFYYEPPDVRLEKDPARREQRRGEWMCGQLSRAIASDDLHVA